MVVLQLTVLTLLLVLLTLVMKDDFEGVELNAGYSGYQHKNDNSYIQSKMDAAGYDYETGNSGLDGKSKNLDLTVGGAFDGGKGHATAYASWRQVDEMLQKERDYALCISCRNRQLWWFFHQCNP